jgi:hypothetical protein
MLGNSSILHLYLIYVRNILSPWFPVGHTFGSIIIKMLMPVKQNSVTILRVPIEWCSHSLALYWSHVRNILTPYWLPIGPTLIGLFSVPRFLLLIPCSEYSQSFGSYWYHVRNILSPWLPIGTTFGIFSVLDFLLVPRSENSLLQAGLALEDYRGSDPKEFTCTSVADALIRTPFTGVQACSIFGFLMHSHGQMI